VHGLRYLASRAKQKSENKPTYLWSKNAKAPIAPSRRTVAILRRFFVMEKQMEIGDTVFAIASDAHSFPTGEQVKIIDTFKLTWCTFYLCEADDGATQLLQAKELTRK
jgi:hypothetical protein